MSYDGQYDDDSLENDEYKERSFDALPAGEYALELETLEMRRTRETQCEMVSGNVIVIDGEFVGRKLFVNYVIEAAPDSDDQFARANRGDVKNLHEVLGCSVGAGWKTRLADLLGRPFLGKVGQKKNKTSGEMENVIRKVMPYGNGPAAAPRSPARPVAAAPAPAHRPAVPAPTPRAPAPAPRPAPGARPAPRANPFANQPNGMDDQIPF